MSKSGPTGAPTRASGSAISFHTTSFLDPDITQYQQSEYDLCIYLLFMGSNSNATTIPLIASPNGDVSDIHSQMEGTLPWMNPYLDE